MRTPFLFRQCFSEISEARHDLIAPLRRFPQGVGDLTRKHKKISFVFSQDLSELLD
jgi:hypothetical protein